MEAVGAGASILTFLTVAFSVTRSIHSALSAIKDGPEAIRFLTDEVAQLESVLQRLKQLSFVSVDDIDRSQLEGLAKKCKGDLAELDSQLKSLDVSTSDGRRGRLWRKLKLCFSEKDLDHIRHVVQGHLQHLTIWLHIIQAQQVSFTAAQSTEILNDLQQLKQEIAALQATSAAALVTEEKSPSTSARVMEVDDEEMDCLPDTPLDESINRLMRLLEKKPCVVESDDSEELLKDIEHLLECIRNDAEPVESEGTCQNCRQDVSKELALMANIILSSPSMMINKTGATRLWRPASEQLLISQERKRKAFEIDDGVMTVTTARRRRKPSSEIEREQRRNETRRDFLAKLTYTSKSTKKMLSLSVNQGQLLYNSFSSMLPCVTVCNILPKNSPVFDTARNGSVQDLVGLLEGGEANIHDHDTDGWSLLHHSVGNLQVLKFLIEQGLDIDEVAVLPGSDIQTTPSHMALVYLDSRNHYEALLYAGADVTLQVKGGPFAVIELLAGSDSEFKHIMLKQTFNISPFVYADPNAIQSQNLIPRATADCYETLQSKPGQALQQIQLLIKQGYDVNSTFVGKGCLHHLMDKILVWIEFLQEYLQLLMLLVEHGADVYSVDEDGYQAWHYAYNVTCEACYLFSPSAKGDLWDAALSRFGYSIPETRKYYPRRARYTPNYTRKDFEMLWQGREHQCPYWDDRPWPASDQNERRPRMREKLCYYCETSWEKRCGDDGAYWELVPFTDMESEYDTSSNEGSEEGGAML
ncbi:hypothetical protein FOC4_g10003519 [Fusarium odoratissimum]|uniref:Azaphilone pigments biosynthesis cluster protein L N-terminal domain-containing protein n=1 Tax=Fusarium oxysporum f. sp. cubense (strain race 4) TaxID=2502994 RepID=N1RXI6_FUSC4|nr:hypothetical protein FOC4_g10003519 [Fusarium odoratissimum]